MMGLPVAVNIAALEFVTNSEKVIQRFGNSSVVNFSTTFYRSSDVAFKTNDRYNRILIWSSDLWYSVYFSCSFDKKDGGPAILPRIGLVEMDVYLNFINSVL